MYRCKMKYIFLCAFLGLGLSHYAHAENPSLLPENINGTQRISASELIDLVVEKEDLVLIDSRIPGDRLKGYIETSISLPDTETNCASLSRIIPSKQSPVVFYCNGVLCGRSAVAIKIAVGCGYENLYWYKAGFEDWLNRSYPYVLD